MTATYDEVKAATDRLCRRVFGRSQYPAAVDEVYGGALPRAMKDVLFQCFITGEDREDPDIDMLITAWTELETNGYIGVRT